MRYVSSVVIAVFVVLAYAASAFAGPPSEITDHAATVMRGNKFVHGPNMTYTASRRRTANTSPTISADCSGNPAFAVEKYGRKMMKLSTCNNPGAFLELRYPAGARMDYWRRTIRSIKTGCGGVKRAMRHGLSKQYMPRGVRCSRVHAFSGSGGGASASWRCGHSRSHGRLRSIAVFYGKLDSLPRSNAVWCDGSSDPRRLSGF